MDNSRKSIPSSSIQFFEEDHEDFNPSLLPHQHPNPITNPPSPNVTNPMNTPTFPARMTIEGVSYSISPHGQIDSVGLNDVNQSFTQKPFILEISNGCDVISCVRQFAQHYQHPLTVLCGHGLISEVDFTFPQTGIRSHSFVGCYQMLSFSGTYNCVNSHSGDNHIISSFTISLIDSQGIFLGGLVASTLKAASPVTLVVCITDDLSHNV